MVKESEIRNWIKNKISQRHARTLADTRTLITQGKNKKLRRYHCCEICSAKGSLLACVYCLKLFHLHCLNLRILDLPFSEWACKSCEELYKNNLIEQCKDFVESQLEIKEKFVKKLALIINRSKKGKKFKKFKRQHPDLVKNGQILYPIEDSLLWSQPKLHSIQYVDFPQDHIPLFPNDLASDLVQICDFLYNFKEIISGPILNCELLYNTLNTSYETSLCKYLLISLSKLLIVTMIRSDGFRKKGCMINYLVYKTKKIVGVDKLIEYSYLTLIENLFTTDIFKELVEEIDIESWGLFQNFSFVEEYFSLPANYKLNLLGLFVNLLLETRMFNEECNKRLEIQTKLTREISECNTQSKQKKIDSTFKSEIEGKIDILKNELAKVSVRTMPIGLDRTYREYYNFPWEDSKVYIKSYQPLNLEQSSWSFYQSGTDLDQLVLSLNEKGTRESALIQGVQETIQKLEVPSKESQLISSQSQNFKVYDMLSLKAWIIKLHESIANSLGVPPSASYITAINQSDVQVLIKLVCGFHQAFSLQSYNTKIMKQVFGLWNSSELYGVWESSLKECKNYSDIFLCMHLLSKLVQEFYVDQRELDFSESAYSAARRTYKEERQNKVKKEPGKTQDLLCYLCRQNGVVIFCEKCSKTAHLQCLKLKKSPEGEWLCPECVFNENSIKMLRSKHIKY